MDYVTDCGFSPHLIRSKSSSGKGAFSFECLCVALSASALLMFCSSLGILVPLPSATETHLSLCSEKRNNQTHFTGLSSPLKGKLRYEGRGNNSWNIMDPVRGGGEIAEWVRMILVCSQNQAQHLRLQEKTLKVSANHWRLPAARPRGCVQGSCALFHCRNVLFH